jgi:hypothetical protein
MLLTGEGGFLLRRSPGGPCAAKNHSLKVMTLMSIKPYMAIDRMKRQHL